MSGQQSAASSSGIVARIVMVLAALAPPALVSAELWPEVRSNPVWSASALAIYWLVLAALRFVDRVGGAVSEKWVPRVADAVDRTISAVLLGYRSKYLDQLGHSVRDIDLLGVATQGEYTLRLQQVYVEVSVLPRALRETSGEPFVGKLVGPAERRTLDSFLGGTEPGVFAVIGGPGSGKTTLLRRIALDLCQRRLRKRSLPVLLYLRDHVEAIVQAAPGAEPTLVSVAASVTWMPGKIPADWLERRLNRARCLVMLDGLDEVAIEEDRQKVVAWVQRQIERYPNNDYVITSRPYGYLANPLSKADVLQVRRFTGEQISQLIQDWYYAIECRSTGDSGDKIRIQSRTKADELLSRLRSQPALYDLAANPLLLTMIANVHRYRGALPGSRAALYGEMCEVLLHRRQEAKGLSAAGTGLRGEQKERVARELALHMMVRKIRDIPADQARQALGPVLTRVSRNVQPPEFLTETAKSGLLVEREVGVYAFAHLTLQEYLAAAEIKERQHVGLLARNVDDPWWRETTLLWAAGTDASSIIKACLDLGSVRALALAFDCADEAREIAPDIRENLEHLLASATNSATADAAARRRVITAVKVARSLRDVIWLHDDTAVCANPAARDIYTLFVEEEKSRGYYRSPDADTDAATGAGAVAVGMRANDATRFVNWINGLFNDGTAYRLPTQDELADNTIGLITDLTHHSIWAQLDAHPRLYCPNGVPHPYQQTIDQVYRFLITDRKQTSILLSFNLARIRARDLDGVLARDLDLDLARDLDLDLDLDLDRARDRARDLALDLARDLARDRARGPDLDRDRDLARDLALDRDLARDLARDLDRDLDLDLDRALALDLDLDLALDLNFALAPVLVVILAARRTPQPAASSTDLKINKVRILVLAYFVLIALWTPGNKRFKAGQAVADFDTFLTNVIREHPQTNHVLPEQAIESIQRAEELLGFHQDPQTARLCSVVRRIVHDTRDLVTPILTRNAPHDAGVIICARIGLTAAAAFANRVTGMMEAYSLLHEVICCLTAVQQRIEGGILPNEVIVLVRA